MKYLAILRGINVSGKNKIKMEDLRDLMSKLGFENCQTYIQSGNVVFEAVPQAVKTLAQKIEQAIAKQYNYEVPVIVKTQDDLAKVYSRNPFLPQHSEEMKFLHFTFCEEEPESIMIEGIEREKYLPDEWKATDLGIYLFCPNGYGRTKLTNTFFERKLKVRATTRNWKTVQKLMEMLS